MGRAGGVGSRVLAARTCPGVDGEAEREHLHVRHAIEQCCKDEQHQADDPEHDSDDGLHGNGAHDGGINRIENHNFSKSDIGHSTFLKEHVKPLF